MQVFKFGGASVKDAGSVRNVAAILENSPRPTVVVISAMAKTTNLLENLVESYFFRKGNTEIYFSEFRNFHLSIAGQLFDDPKDRVYEEINNVLVELQWSLEEEPSFTYDHHYDQVVSLGEILSTRIVSAYLRQRGINNEWLDARGIIQTDNTYREGHVHYELTQSLINSELRPLLKKNGLVITQGFIGGTSENYTTTLGREGSDYSAALLAFFLDAREVIIWKDVPGVLNADPKYFKNTKKIAQLTYHDAIELTYYGASVIHPKTIKPLQNKNIPLHVKSFLHPDESGTLIKDTGDRNNVTSYIFKEKQILISIQPRDFSFIAEDKLSVIFSMFSKHHVRINVMQNSAISFSACADYDLYRVEPLMKELRAQFNVLYNNNVQLMTIRNYNQDIISKLSEKKLILLEQRSRNTVQLVMKDA
jgi:aspartate kinase